MNLEQRLNTLLCSEKPLEQKLQSVANLLYDEIPYYNWVGFYFSDPEKQELVLGPYKGEATEHMRIPFGKGICGQVALSNENFEVPDVSKEDNYLSCSVKTKAELVVPIIKDGKNMGQIDIDSHSLDPFSEKDIELLENLNKKIAELF